MMACRHVFRLMESTQNESFPVISGVKKGCIMTQTVFSMMFSAMLTLTDAFQDRDACFPIRCKPDLRCRQMC